MVPVRILNWSLSIIPYEWQANEAMRSHNMAIENPAFDRGKNYSVSVVPPIGLL